MKPLIISLLLIIFATLVITTLSFLVDSAENFLTGASIPKNNAEVAGVQKYNIPPISKSINPPQFSARAVLAKDLESSTILFEKNLKTKLPIASTTKIMTALVSSAYFAQNAPLTVNSGAGIIGASAGFLKGETLSFRSLLYGMLLNSGNDAAYSIAENYPGGVTGFVTAMNQKAKELNLLYTHFDNPAGFDSPNHFSSAEDLAIITQEALKNPQLAKIFATKETEVSSMDKTKTHSLRNLNKLLSSVVGVLGVKTGYTKEAKENLVGLVERNNHRILTVVLGSNDRFGETSALIEWVYKNFTWSN
ncbi:D-alanyl-D-alanine carboxypeptidase [Candidatus Daviesbacteria bacterium]|nr:D-alanyl-D-alanine carboxypeptidase [Candidatus Daviesbacteria bacterium]